jgi:hypothetical protein
MQSQALSSCRPALARPARGLHAGSARAAVRVAPLRVCAAAGKLTLYTNPRSRSQARASCAPCATLHCTPSPLAGVAVSVLAHIGARLGPLLAARSRCTLLQIIEWYAKEVGITYDVVNVDMGVRTLVAL